MRTQRIGVNRQEKASFEVVFESGQALLRRCEVIGLQIHPVKDAALVFTHSYSVHTQGCTHAPAKHAVFSSTHSSSGDSGELTLHCPQLNIISFDNRNDTVYQKQRLKCTPFYLNVSNIF